ncbi:helix-turn-helix domain-containing protein [Lacticaseibacillus pantheris]|uniref:helix-turn-helix domain-containing protein n=1 Tax=Lacticaseibacillus pantheris TaxID=171523 RepID=UPI0006D2A99A|nr:helix-turn-helix domain-containing protein [Lacticaseibacillus pantheris]
MLQESIQFQYLDYIIQSRSANTDRFCQDHFISRSTLARKTTPLRTMLELHGIKLSFSRPGFSGSEQNIRQFLYIFYWLCFRGVEWPFTTVPQNRIAERYAQLPQVGMNTIDRLRNLLMLAVAI